MQHAILRNFGGLKSDDWDPFQEFERRLKIPTEELNRENSDEKVCKSLHNNNISRNFPKRG
jgi:hypothetical protein